MQQYYWEGNKLLDVIFTVLIIVSKKHNQLSNCTEVVATALGSRVNWVSWASLTDKVPFKFWHWRQLRKHLFGKVFVCPYNWVKCWFKCPNKIWAVNGTLVQSVGYGRHGLVLIAQENYTKGFYIYDYLKITILYTFVLLSPLVTVAS